MSRIRIAASPHIVLEVLEGAREETCHFSSHEGKALANTRRDAPLPVPQVVAVHNDLVQESSPALRQYVKIEELLSKRSDLSTFLVHLTRTQAGQSAKDRLKAIIKDRRIQLGTPMGQAVSTLNAEEVSTDSQKCVCFTETPLENVKFMLGAIEGRRCEFEPYGVAITKRHGRKNGVNPIWYVDITPGHEWLTNPLNELVKEAIKSQVPFADCPISKITPFIEQMGSGKGATGASYRKEFWWEREWRSTSSVCLGSRLLVLCPEDEIEEFEKVKDELDVRVGASFIDPRWSLEQIIASLAGFPTDEVSLG
jgi:hypothetical protein